VKPVRLSLVAGKRRGDSGLEISENASHSSRLSSGWCDLADMSLIDIMEEGERALEVDERYRGLRFGESESIVNGLN
jgi:hypothetical protein